MFLRRRVMGELVESERKFVSELRAVVEVSNPNTLTVNECKQNNGFLNGNGYLRTVLDLLVEFGGSQSLFEVLLLQPRFFPFTQLQYLVFELVV